MKDGKGGEMPEGPAKGVLLGFPLARGAVRQQGLGKGVMAWVGVLWGSSCSTGQCGIQMGGR